MGLLGLRASWASGPLGPLGLWGSGFLGLWGFWASGYFSICMGLLGLKASGSPWSNVVFENSVGVGPCCDNILSMGFLCVFGLFGYLGPLGLWASGPLAHSSPLVQKASCNIRPLG